MTQTNKKSPKLKEKINKLKFRLNRLSTSIYKNKMKSGLKGQFAKHSYAMLRSDLQKYMIVCQLIHLLQTMPIESASHQISLALS